MTSGPTTRSPAAPDKAPESTIGVVLLFIAIWLILDGAETILDYHTEAWQHEGKLMVMFGFLLLGVAQVVRQLTRIEFELRRK